VHIAFLELVIDPVCSVVFEAEPAERDAMQRPPRDPAAPLFGLTDMAAAFAQGALVLAAVAGLAAWLLHVGVPEAQARGTGFLALVLANLGLIVFNRSFGRSPLDALVRPNPALWWVVAGLGALLALVYGWAPLRELFRFSPLTVADMGLALAVAVAVTALLFAARSVASRVRPGAGVSAARPLQP
jgi:Ca2+-transporting ATPase